MHRLVLLTESILWPCIVFAIGWKFPSRSVERGLSEQRILNKAYCTKDHFNKYKLNIKHLNNVPIEQFVNWPRIIWTSGYWTSLHLNNLLTEQSPIEHCTNSFEQKANWTLWHWTITLGLTRLEGSRIGASPLPLSASLRAKCHPGWWLSLIL